MNRVGGSRARWPGKPARVGAWENAATKYRAALAWLYGLQRFGIKLGLENSRRLIADLRLDLSASRIIHVAGTNGKGSVCAMIDSICRMQGYRTGLFTSPHLVTFRERIRVNGENISEPEVASGLTAIRRRVASWNPRPTFFEVTTALALKHLSEANAEILILETGMGGRLDATNAIQSNLSIITPIDFDHEKWLGDSLEKIAAEKAGIIKPKAPVISSPQEAEAAKVIIARALECESSLLFMTDYYEKTPIALEGYHQKQNAAVAIAALHSANIRIDHNAIVRGLAMIEWPARFQRWDERTIIDGAHNPAAARVLAEAWRQAFGDQRATVILAVLAEKDLHGIWQALAPIADSVLLPKIRSERAAAPEGLAEILASLQPFCRAAALPAGNRSGCPTISIAKSVAEALGVARARPNPILITGSLHFAGEALAYLRGEPSAFEDCAQ